MKSWVKISQGTKYAGVSERTFRSWLKAGLPFTKPPSGPTLVNLNDIDNFLKIFLTSSNKRDEIVDSILEGF
jgi:hypothetical protein